MGAWRYDRGVSRGRHVRLEVDGQPVDTFAGESVAVALLAAGRSMVRRTAKRAEPRGVFCGMGVCFECAVTVDGQPNVRACMTTVRDGMTVELGRARPSL